MNWRIKSRTIGLVGMMPFSARIYYLLQRFVTRSIPRSASSIDSVVRHEQRHLASFSRFTGKGTPSVLFEFGAGWDLCSAIVRHQMGAKRQQMVDLNRLASAWQINHVIEYLSARAGVAGSDAPLIDSLDDLGAKGIVYQAPFDARYTGYPAGSIDLIVSTNTLEHIPPQELEAILAECGRILADDGIMSMKIDYSDHYSHADSSIGPYNFLQFSERQWQVHNHANHFQSRLRHCDYERLFRELGFTILHEESWRPEDAGSPPPLDERFQSYDFEALLPTDGYFVLRKVG